MRGTNIQDINIHLHNFDNVFGLHKGENQFTIYCENVLFVKKIEEKSYTYPPFPPLTALPLKDAHPFETTGVDNFGPLFVKDVFL